MVETRAKMMAMKTWGGRYEPLGDEQGFVGTKIGGRLVLQIADDVPKCRECEHPMDFLIQLRLPPEDNGGYCAALVFMCLNDPWVCKSLEPDSGANAVILVREMVSIPPTGVEEYPAFQMVWVEHPEFTNDPNEDVDESEEALAEEEWETFIDRFGWNKRGGFPMWQQNPEEPTCPACGGPTIFKAQFDSVLGKSLSGEDVLVNFGDVGAGYLFLCEKRCSDRGGAFVWQCS